jgi:hypothetical protein
MPLRFAESRLLRAETGGEANTISVWEITAD